MGSANEILAQMKEYEEDKLLDGVQKHDYMLFWEINQPLLDKHIADMKKYAIKIYSNVYQSYVQPNFEINQYHDDSAEQSGISKEEVQQTQKFICWEQENYDITLGQLLSSSFPNLFELQRSDSSLVDDTYIVKKEMQIICHGLKIDLDTPMYWLQLNMSYLDNFLYLSLHSPTQ